MARAAWGLIYPARSPFVCWMYWRYDSSSCPRADLVRSSATTSSGSGIQSSCSHCTDHDAWWRFMFLTKASAARRCMLSFEDRWQCCFFTFLGSSSKSWANASFRAFFSIADAGVTGNLRGGRGLPIHLVSPVAELRGTGPGASSERFFPKPWTNMITLRSAQDAQKDQRRVSRGGLISSLHYYYYCVCAHSWNKESFYANSFLFN